jgi:hypothetical protein
MWSSSVSPGASSRTGRGGTDQKRIRFQIEMVEEERGERKQLSSATLEGPPGMDFIITLHAGRYDMEARFLTDLSNQHTLEVRSKLNTRRLYGYSEKKLPLYEEDTRSQALELGFDEQMIVFPFGESGGDNLHIEIAPAMTAGEVYQPSGQFGPPEITFLQKMQGVIHIEAIKVPHRFQVEAALLQDGHQIAGGAGEFLLQQKQELALQATGGGSADTVTALALSIDRYIRGCPIGSAAFSFDIYRSSVNVQSGRETVASDWAGIHPLGSDAVYDLSATSLAAVGKKRELKLRIMPASGEAGY